MDYRLWWARHLGRIRWKSDGNGLARCPFHQDQRPSLSVHAKTGLWYCFAGCGGGTLTEFARRRGAEAPPRNERAPEAVYDYRDEAGTLLFQVVRFPGKQFRYRRPDGTEGWVWNLQGVRRVLYRLPELQVSSDSVLIPEGEKDVETLRARDFTATTNPMGAKGWREEYSPLLRDRDCVLLADNDEPGRARVEQAARSLRPYAARVSVLVLPGLAEHQDVTDWFAQGHTPEELHALVQAALQAPSRVAVSSGATVEPRPEGRASTPPTPVPSVTALRPPHGWLREYVDYGAAVTDAPHAYHLFAGLTCLAVALGRRIWLPYGSQLLYPNLYVCLLGPSALARKSTVIGIAREVLGRFEEHAVLPDEFSPERLYKLLAAHPAACLLWSEFGAFLRYAERSYMLGMKEALTQLYDCPPVFRRALQSETVEVKAPTLSILTASTPEWLLANMREVDLLGGFFPRFLYVFPEPKPHTFPIPPPGDAHAINRLVEGLQRVKHLSGEIQLGQARALYDQFFAEVDHEAAQVGEGDLYGVFLGRLPTHVLKLALCLHAAESSDLVLAPDTMARAIAVGQWLKGQLRTALHRGLTHNPKQRERQKVLRLIQRDPGITRGLLLRRSNLSAKELDEALTTLDQAGLVRAEGAGSKGNPLRYSPLEGV